MENYYHEPSLYARWTSSGRKLGGLQAQLVAQTTRLEVAETALRSPRIGEAARKRGGGRTWRSAVATTRRERSLDMAIVR